MGTVLMPSDRHRPADLALWAELEAADIEHGRSERVADFASRGRETVRGFAAAGDCYASVSWGKDSTVLAHLVATAAPHVPLVFVRPANRLRTPERDAVRDAFLAVHEVEYREIVVDYVRGSEAETDRQFFGALKSAGDRYMSGIRADESSGRALRMRRHGLATSRTCAPLGYWTGADVFGYAAVHGLPLCSWYGMLGGGRWPREHLRVDDLGGDRGFGFGRRDWEREYYGDVLRRLESRASS